MLLWTMDTDVIVSCGGNSKASLVWAVGGFCDRKAFQVYIIPVHGCQVSWTWQIPGSANFLCLHWEWHSVVLSHQIKEFAWGTWKAFYEVTATFLVLSNGPGPVVVNNDYVALLERFTILLYDRTSNVVNIDEACQELSTKKGRHMDAIPPTRGEIVQHINRAVYQNGHC